jgi:hydroxymethylglutaryl-CoA synthase
MDQALVGMEYNRVVGNAYTASIYLALTSTLENSAEDLAGKSIGLFSYGSGATGEFFDATVVPGYRDHLFTDRHKALLKDRVAVDYDDYVSLWDAPAAQDGAELTLPDEAQGRYRLASINDNKRIYIDKNA